MRTLGVNILICENDDTVGFEAARRFACAARESVAVRGRFYVAIPGGWSPRGMFEALAGPPWAGLVEWDSTHVFFTDERCVPPDRSDSNYGLAHEMLLSKVPLPESHVHRFQAELDAHKAAENYENELVDVMGKHPRFDLVVLGMGKDTHTASLFPHSPAINEMRRLAVAVHVAKLNADRLTLTIPVLCNARSIVVMALGDEKSGAVRTVLRGEHDPARHPIQAIRPVDGALLWIVDHEAASKL